ncbi:beta-glucuronidase-like [Zophobas morio]|uniref:beta-glucuronidase-like n=1 Tax=Zophobas morio TaxID=2755281 RepID=UPI0030832CA3
MESKEKSARDHKMDRRFLILSLLLQVKSETHHGGILYPRQSETRQVVSLDGLWNFVVPQANNPLQGFDEHWYKRHLKELTDVEVYMMPVPSSYNDITTSGQIRDHVGLVWYDRKFFVPKSWYQIGRVWLRFGSVSYASQVWINGQLVMSHEIGHLPFLAEVTNFLKYGKENLITVACDNTLLSDTVPQGKVDELETGRLVQLYSFDFFNYAGIDRPVTLYTTPKNYIDDISVATEVDGDVGFVDYKITYISDFNVTCRVSLIDKKGNVVAMSDEYDEPYGILEVPNAHFWWPYLMDPNPGYLYTLQVELLSEYGDLIDKYSQPIGIRSVTWTNTSLLINNRPVYLHGFGRHEDSDIRGKGLDLPLIVRDYNLIKWIGANAYRTSHYPYAEEIMDLADELGIMIIDECPSVNTEFFFDTLLVKHKNSLTELIKRDKNRPSVIMWSAANEPRTQYPIAKSYFKEVIDHIKNLDITRPTTIAEAQSVNNVESSEFVDIVSFNRYNGWYANGGNLDAIPLSVVGEATAWHEKFNKPVIMQEYGGDTLEGLHFTPEFIWSEEYQVHLMSKHFQAFDELRAKGFFIGEFIWNFADFKTAQTYTRVGGNKKGIFTRSRQPKSSAHHLRKRYWALARQLYNASVPSDLYNYVAGPVVIHDEL